MDARREFIFNNEYENKWIHVDFVLHQAWSIPHQLLKQLKSASYNVIILAMKVTGRNKALPGNE